MSGMRANGIARQQVDIRFWRVHQNAAPFSLVDRAVFHGGPTGKQGENPGQCFRDELSDALRPSILYRPLFRASFVQACLRLQEVVPCVGFRNFGKIGIRMLPFPDCIDSQGLFKIYFCHQHLHTLGFGSYS
ncbi:MAG: hypothetical protein LBI62_05305 [Candidatus Accumulibacter sp.]|jgi:hypothetical protein|nr:hypothetical protein [Accumulibacter sp.]